ncbi:MAG: hypothetical protein HY205_04130 [Nitrospirae bacterium]|nr:hypothetical protein [Nitrospirota bacterium]
MILSRYLVLSVFGLLLAACGSAAWMHPTKQPDEYLTDYKACEEAIYKDPKLQQGNQLLFHQALDRCVAKKGWVLKDTQE